MSIIKMNVLRSTVSYFRQRSVRRILNQQCIWARARDSAENVLAAALLRNIKPRKEICSSGYMAVIDGYTSALRNAMCLSL
jgi:hypothetical protein